MTQKSPYFHIAGLPGGAGAPAGVAAEECGDGEQVSESQGGGAYSPEPTGEEGAGSHCVGTAGTTVRQHTYTQTLDFNSLKHSNYNCELKTSPVKAGPLDYINSHTHSIFQHYSVCTCSAGVRKGVEVGLLLNCKLC